MSSICPITTNSKAAFDVLAAGGLAAIATETVYGLGADATNEIAVSRIYQAKGRPSFNPLIIHVADIAMAKQYGEFDDLAKILANRFWPGPLTLVLPLRADHGLAPSVTAGLNTIAIRQPTGVMATLAAELGRPIAAPSANCSGRISPTTALHVMEDLGDKIDIILDGGPCTVGLESTIVKPIGNVVHILREGTITRDLLSEITIVEDLADPNRIEAPGQLLAHYAPRRPCRINATSPRTGEAYLAFGAEFSCPENTTHCLNLSPSGNLEEAARNLYAMLKQLDEQECTGIAVAPIPHAGIGLAINDRLKRAAHETGMNA